MTKMATLSKQNDAFIPTVIKVVIVPLSKLVADSSISPRDKWVESTAQSINKAIKEYCRAIKCIKLPPLKVAPLANDRFIIIDGLLRYEAYKKAKTKEIEVEVLGVDGTDYTRMSMLALHYNLFHAIKLPTKAIRKYASILYQQGESMDGILKKTGQPPSTLYRWTEKVRKRKEKETMEGVYNLHMKGKTQQEISTITSISQPSISRILSTHKKKRNKTK